MNQTSPDTAASDPVLEELQKLHQEGTIELSTIPKKEPREKTIPVVEIFGPTIQGEGFMAGERTSFIRFGLCDYKCIMCDSMHAVDPMRVKANATWLSPAAMLDDILRVMDPEKQFTLNAPWITFSGGNPCIHDLSELIKRIRGLYLTHGELKIAVETQGTFLPEWLHWCDVVTVSPKPPGMGEQYEHDKFMRFLMAFKHHKGFNVKIVVFSMADIEWARSINDFMKEEGLGDRMYLSLGNHRPPGLDNDLSADEIKLELLKNYMILNEDLLQIPDMANVKFFPQLHVLTWGNKQGV